VPPILACVPILLRPTAPVATDALLPADPGRALALAQELLTEPKMSNHAHGLWGYTGATARGRGLTIQATGAGGPSAALVLADLAAQGVRRAIRVGTCIALGDLAPGTIVNCDRALAVDGTSRSLGANPEAAPDESLAQELRKLSPASRSGTVASSDLVHVVGGDAGAVSARRREWLERGAIAVEMEAAALFAAGARLGVATACVLVVTELARGGDRIGDDELAQPTLEAARIAAVALA
jgi:uridine phosphorylase